MRVRGPRWAEARGRGKWRAGPQRIGRGGGKLGRGRGGGGFRPSGQNEGKIVFFFLFFFYLRAIFKLISKSVLNLFEIF